MGLTTLQHKTYTFTNALEYTYFSKQNILPLVFQKAYQLQYTK